MSYTQNSISSLVAQFLRLQKNALEIINGLNQVATSTNDNVEIQLLDEFGFPTTASIPAYGYLRAQIQRLDSNIQALAGLGDNFSTIRNPDGTFSPIFKAQPLRDPLPLVGLPVPSTFATKDNWFFESFLSPLLYVSIDATAQLPNDADRILVKRIIANTVTEAQKLFFDQELKGRNDVTEQQFNEILFNAGIGTFVDEDIVQLPLRSIRYVGNFDVLSIFDDIVSTTDANNQTVQETRRNYRLNTLNYTDTTSNITDGKTLAVNDFLTTIDGSMYQVVSVNINETTVQLRRSSGYQPVTIGTDVLSFSSSELGPRNIQVNIGYDERQGVFFKKIDDNYNIVSSTWSTGIVFFSNELRINTTSGVQTLEQYYLTSVADLGQAFLSMAKEKKVASYQGLVPNIPVVVSENFKVEQINTQLTNGTSAQQLNEKVAQKAALKAEISQLDAAITAASSNLNVSSLVETAPNVAGISNQVVATSFQTSPTSGQAQIDSLTNQRKQKQQLLSSIIQDINTLTADIPALTEAPKYRVRGFWAIPDPVSSPQTGPQQVVQFNVRYKYLSDSGAANPVQQTQFLDNNGQLKTGAFSNWTEFKTPLRKKIYDTNTGTYVWAPELTSDSEVNNINQLEIPITKGEQVEIQIQSVSEAGYPDNPVLSDWSTSVVIPFPADLSTQSQASNTTTNLTDLAVLAIQEDLQSKGIDQFLSKQTVLNGKTYFLDTTSINSGITSPSGQPLDLFQVIRQLQDQISALEARVANAAGTLEVFFVSSSGDITKVSPGTVVNVPSIVYNRVYANPTTSDAGKVASSISYIRIQNSSAGLLELSSSLPGGLDTLAGSDGNTYSYPDGYFQNLRYGEVPISITSLVPSNIKPLGSLTATITSFQELKQAPPYMSANENGQFIYPRWKSAGLDQEYYSASVRPNSTYDYLGVNGVPVNNSAVLPFQPTSTTPSYPNGGVNTSVWNGATASSGGVVTGLGNGYISEFCISKDHPAISNNVSFEDLVKPNLSNGSVVYPYFRHSNYFFTDTTQQNFYQQLGWAPVQATFATGPASGRGDDMYPNKLGFDPNDVYLIGKYTCGVYAFLGPSVASDIQVEGSTSLASTFVSQGVENAINVPLIFQARVTDALGYIGGFRIAGQPSNITYTKKMGVDIQVRNKAPFSFDLSFTATYKPV